MILLADAGSSKIRWILINKGAINLDLETTGFNPNYHETSVLHTAIEKVKNQMNCLPNQIYYYGAGCSNVSHQNRVSDIFNGQFAGISCTVSHDLLGAAKASCGNEAGIAAILGTGSSMIYYDGYKIGKQVTSLGYIIDDSGGGFDLGKRLLYAYFKNKLSSAVYREVKIKIGESEQFVTSLYESDSKNKFVAEFAPIVYSFRHKKEVHNLIYAAFQQFIGDNIHFMPANLPLHFTGSVAYYFQDELRKVVNDLNLPLGKIEKDPTDGLIRYHSGANARQ
jgi:glucosamine kinase